MSTTRDSHMDSLRARLEDIAEELADLARASLSEALAADDEDGTAGPQAQERLFSRARRAVLKAAGLLGGAVDDDAL